MNLNNLSGSELQAALLKHEQTLIAQKKSQLKFTDNLQFEPEVNKVFVKDGEGEKKEQAGTVTDNLDSGALHVKVVANTAWWMDSHGDVLTDKAYDDSIKARGNSIPHLLDHTHSAIGHIGDTQKVYTSEVPLRDLGVNKDGTTTALIMESLVRKDYNEKAFQFYSNGKIDQHSIGLAYGDIQLAINKPSDKEYAAQYAVWKDNIDNIINKDKAEAKGYFWLIPKVDIRENSAVLFGANSLTPTLATGTGKDEFTMIKTEAEDENEGETVSLSHVSKTSPQLKGNDMTLEEALLKLAQKDAEIEALKANQLLEATKVKVAETNRIKGILDAQKTFGTELDLSMKFIDAGATVDMVVLSLEAVKSASQSQSHVDTSKTSTVGTLQNVPGQVKSFSENIDAAFEVMEKSDMSSLWKGVK